MTRTQDWLTAAALHVMDQANGGRLTGAELAASVHPVSAPEGAEAPLIVLRASGADLASSFAGARPVREDFVVVMASNTAADARATVSRLTAQLRADGILSTVIPAGDDFDPDTGFYTRMVVVTLRTRHGPVPDPYPPPR